MTAHIFSTVFKHPNAATVKVTKKKDHLQIFLFFFDGESQFH